ncbi:MAG: FG-GAP-like repeat-containing protein [Myxococcota bacterium]
MGAEPPADADAGDLDGPCADVEEEAAGNDAAETGASELTEVAEVAEVAEVRDWGTRCLNACDHAVALGCGPPMEPGDDCGGFCQSMAAAGLDVDCIAAAASCQAVKGCVGNEPALCPGPCCPETAPQNPAGVTLPSGLGGVFAPVEVADPTSLAGIALVESAGGTIGTLSSGFFGDLNGGGSLELVVSGGEDSAPVVFHYDGVGLVALDGLGLGEGRVMFIDDLDDDGRADVVMLRKNSPMVLWNAGDGQFVARPMVEGPQPMGLTIRALALADLDADGTLDAVGQSSGCCSMSCPAMIPLLRTGSRTWTARPELMKSVNHATLHAILVAPLGPAQAVLFGTGGVGCGGAYQGTYERATGGDEGWPEFVGVAMLDEEANALMQKSVPMGAAVADADGDGAWDLALTLDPGHAIYRGRPSWPLEDATAMSGIGVCGRMETPASRAVAEPLIPWSVEWLDLDRDGRDDLVFTHGPDPGVQPHGMFEQPVTAHYNAGDMRFADMTAQIGLDATGNWRGLLVDDLDGDGDPDLFIGGIGRLPWLLRNDVATPNHGFTLRLHGTTSNHLGIGAVVEVEVAGQSQPQRHVMGAVGNPAGVGRPMRFVGLGLAKKADLVRVRWPSGLVQEVHDLPAGAVHTIEEPPTITVEPASRHLSSDGPEGAKIMVYPRNPDGSIREDATVEIRIAHGVGSFEGPARATRGGVARVIAAPGVSGSTVIEVLIDGEPLSVRPRVYWD